MATAPELIQHHIDLSGMSQADVCRAAPGLTTANLSRILSGKRASPGIDQMALIADALGLPVAAIMPPGLSDVQVRALRAAEGADLAAVTARLAALVAELAAELSRA